MTVVRRPSAAPGEPIVELHHVARRFEKKLDRNRSLQDLFIRLFRGRKAPADAFWPLRDISLSIRRGELTITAPTALYDLPTPDSAPAGLAVGDDGAIWLVEQRAGQIARFDPVNESFTEFPFPANLFCSGKPPVCVPDPQGFDSA